MELRGRRTRRSGRIRGPLGAILLTLGAALALGGSAGAHPSVTLTVGLLPTSLSPGQQALASVAFTNSSSMALDNVVVALRFPSGLSAARTAGCTPVGGRAGIIDCSLGTVASGKTVTSFVGARVASQLNGAHRITLGFSLRIGASGPIVGQTAASAVSLAPAASANVAACAKTPRTLSATLDAQTTALPAPPAAASSLGLLCTPLDVGVYPAPSGGIYHTKLAVIFLPRLARPATVKLSFPDERLPDENMITNLPPGVHPSYDNPDPLWEINPSNASKKSVVPHCDSGPAFPPGWHSCVISVTSNDPDGDYDAGTIALLVQGSRYGDPRYVG